MMKSRSDNYRPFSIQRIIKRVKSKDVNFIFYKPVLHQDDFYQSKVVNNLADFKSHADVVVADRLPDKIGDVGGENLHARFVWRRCLLTWRGFRWRYRFFQNYRRTDFADALAQLPPGTWPKDGWEQMACYRLGLYKTVAHSEWDGEHLQGGIAKAVSLASCGMAEEAEAVVRKLTSRHRSKEHMAMLADRLAPLLPELAITLVNNSRTAQLPLKVTLLLMTGSPTHATQLLNKVTSNQRKQFPELHLLESNVLGGTPDQQIARINDYLETYNLPSLELSDGDTPPCPTNFKPDHNLPKKDGPLVTVLMTAFNTSRRIKPAVEGLLAQTWNNLEIVIIDDASSDDTSDVVDELASTDSRIRTLRMHENAGTYVAKTAGIRLARGDFITCHDSDDWSHPLRIEKQMQPLINNPHVVATTSKWVRMEDNGCFYARPVHPLARLNPASALFRRNQVEEQMGLWDLVRTGADSEFNARLRLVFGRRAVKGLNLPLAFGAHRANSLMTAPKTGYNSTGISPARLDYWEAWTHWHIRELHAGRKPKMPPEGRPFSVSASLSVPTKRVTSSTDLHGSSDPVY